MGTMVVLAHGGHFAVYLFPVGAIVFLLWLLKKEAPKKDTTTPTVLPKSPLSRQVFAATRPKKRLHTSSPKGGGFRAPPIDVTPMRPPGQDRRGA
jgi:hypothetical protein